MNIHDSAREFYFRLRENYFPNDVLLQYIVYYNLNHLPENKFAFNITELRNTNSRAYPTIKLVLEEYHFTFDTSPALDQYCVVFIFPTELEVTYIHLGKWLYNKNEAFEFYDQMNSILNSFDESQRRG